MSVNALQVTIGMEKSVFHVSEERYSIIKRISVNAQMAQDGMVLDVPQCKYVETVKNGTFLNSFVNARIIVFGMEHIV